MEAETERQDDHRPTRIPRGKEINLKALFGVVKKRLLIIVLSTIILSAIGYMYYSVPVTPLYSVSARVLIEAGNAEQMNTMRVMIREPIVLNEVVGELGLPQSPQSLRQQIGVGSVDGSSIALVSVIDSNPERAAAIANVLIDSYKRVSSATLHFTGITILSQAEPNYAPINPKSNRPLYLSFLGGIALGVGLAFLRDSLDDSVRTTRDIEDGIGLNMLGGVSKLRKRDVRNKAKLKKNVSLRGETLGS